MSEIESATDVAPVQEEVRLVRAPRAGELTSGWRVVTAVTWMMVVVGLGCVWKTSDQLGLSTWWLGPRGEPHSIVIQLLPFVPPVLMVLASINRIRYLPWFGLAASGLVVLTGLFDVVRFTGLGALEIAIGVAAATVSLVSLGGMYRDDTPAAVEPAAPDASISTPTS
jgi:hypothetical protein